MHQKQISELSSKINKYDKSQVEAKMNEILNCCRVHIGLTKEKENGVVEKNTPAKNGK